MAMGSEKPQVVIVTPALRDANNGNWTTAWRWQRHLAATCRARIVATWPDVGVADERGADERVADERVADDQVMLALHARRSAASIAAWSAAHPGRGLAVTLTGTDLYRDIRSDADAQRSLQRAQVLITLQEKAPAALPAEVRSKARVIFQSTTSRQPLEKTQQHLRALMVGHLRTEKSPETLFAAARLLAGQNNVCIDHIGDGLDPDLAAAARTTMLAAPNYRWLGGLPHETVRRRIQRAHVLIHASRMEGGAHVIMEAVVSGTPVLAARVDGNVGMLGDDYAGYFPWNDAPALASLLLRCREDAGFLPHLLGQCRSRAPLFAPAAERAALQQVVFELLES